MKTHDINFATRLYLLAAEILSYNFSDIIFGPYGGYWRQFRKVCTLELLSVKRVQSFRSIREEQGTSGTWSWFYYSDLFPSFKLLPVISGMRAKLERFHHDFDLMLEIIIEEHKARNANPKNSDDVTDDLVDVLLHLQDHGDHEIPLTTDHIKAVILTSSTTAEWALSEMMKNPRVMEKAQAEARLHPPLPLLLPRQNNERCEINGYEIPVKTKVIVNAWAIGRDSDYWNEAYKFDPERFIDSSVNYKGINFEYIPFGAGRRICPGMSYVAYDIILLDWWCDNNATSKSDGTNVFSWILLMLTVRRWTPMMILAVNTAKVEVASVDRLDVASVDRLDLASDFVHS
ncbi:hypothetical protein F3Y22_tig00110458pilonHSYRG00470 [Hibiscus syriacus]|uniref:Uncharacterized protein n=1 Tax=Hibiscus syriacus TaxID=106335 RepID=A0A6A3AMY9_HIBSY|nr:hypothetical protein F3Y22_tig00110458pilonHSYRG00470 [Hibiscus syriacus]